MSGAKCRTVGQSVIEIVIAIAIFALLASSFVSLGLGSFAALGRSEDFTSAAALSSAAIEAVRAVRDGAWNEIILGPVVGDTSDGYWKLAPGTGGETIGKFTRATTVSEACRDTFGGLVGCSSGTPDLGSRFVESRVYWPSFAGGENEVTRTTLLTNWDSEDFIQNDWSGGDGQTEWSDETRYLSDDGNINPTTPGQLTLATVTTDAGSSNSDFTTNATGWNFAPWGVNPGEVTPTGAWQFGQGNPGGQVTVTIPYNASKNKVGGYWQEKVSIPEDGLGLICSVDWRTSVWSVSGDNFNDFRSFLFLDQTSGPPTIGKEIWVSASTGGLTPWQSKSSIDCSGQAPVAGDYYLKVAIWLDARPNKTGPITVNFDNVGVKWQESSYALSGVLTSSPIDLGKPSAIQTIAWNRDLTACAPTCSAKVKLRTASDLASLLSAPWSLPFALATGEVIDPIYNGNRWIQYQVLLAGNGQSTPIFHLVKINHK